MTETIRIRPARTGDVAAIKTLVAPLADQRILMAKETVAYYESLQEFRIAEAADGEVIGCGALHVMWEDLAEVRTLATSDAWRGKGVGHLLVERLLDDARALGISRVFCLTFEVEFFKKHGFDVMADQTAVDRWCTRSSCARMTRALPNSWTSRGSSRIRWATPG